MTAGESGPKIALIISILALKNKMGWLSPVMRAVGAAGFYPWFWRVIDQRLDI